jgi:hypothetical protein
MTVARVSKFVVSIAFASTTLSAGAQTPEKMLGDFLAGAAKEVASQLSKQSPDSGPAAPATTNRTRVPNARTQAAIPGDVIQRYERLTNIARRGTHSEFMLPDPKYTTYSGSSIAGVYAVRTKEGGGAPPPLWGQPDTLFAEDGSWLMYREDGVREIAGLRANDVSGHKGGSETLPFVRTILQQIDVATLPKVGKGRATFIYHGAIDCPHCRKIESTLSSSGASYRIHPITLDPTNDTLQSAVEGIFCSAAPAKEWHTLVTSGKFRKNSGKCSQYPKMTIMDIQFLLGATATPAFLFSDGTILHNLDSALRKAREAELSEAFFD